MANYTKKFTKPYANGYKDRPDTSTPVTADIKNAETNALLAIEEYLAQNDITSFSIDGMLNEGYSIAIVEIDGEPYNLNIPELAYTSAITGGTKIGNIKLGKKSYDLYAPTGGSGGGSTVTAEATLTEGTEIGKVTIDGKEIILYAPTASAITVDAELSADSENAIQNKVVDAAVKNLQQQIDAGGTGGSITVDSTLSTESENPVQNKVVTAELDKKLEVLGDDEQAPDAVKFVLDSELSLTSENGVKNKTIAQEFENYATGVKMVAKAAEAETAQTAGSATTAETATKAAQDGNGNVIADTYAKKTEIPQGAVVDDSLSSTSANPVQNKVVKAEFDKVNSNLSDLKVSDVAGGKNLLNKNKFAPNITISKDESIIKDDVYNLIYVPIKANIDYVFSRLTDSSGSAGVVWGISNLFPSEGGTSSYNPLYSKSNKFNVKSNTDGYFLIRDRFDMHEDGTGSNWQLEEGTQATDYEPYIPSVKMLASDLSDVKDGTTPVAKAVADEDGNNIKNTYAKKTETSETATEDVNVVLNSDLFDSTYSDITCVRIGKLCVLSFTIRAKNTIFSTIDKIVLISIVGKKYQPKKISAGGRRQIFQGFAVGNYDENGKQSQSLNNTVRIITNWDSNYTEIITRDKDRINWSGYVQGQIMWVTD